MPSIEDLIAANTAALTENTASNLKVAGLLEASNAGRAAAVDKITEVAGATGGATRGRKPGSSNKTEPAAAAPAAAPEPSGATVADPNIEDFRKAGGVFMGIADGDLKTSRTGFVKSMLAHFGVAKYIDIPAEHYANVMDWMNQKIADPAAEIDFDAGQDEPAAPPEEDLMG